MTQADTPMPGEDPGALIEDPARLDELEPAVEEDIEANPQPQPAKAPQARDPSGADAVAERRSS